MFEDSFNGGGVSEPPSSGLVCVKVGLSFLTFTRSLLSGGGVRKGAVCQRLAGRFGSEIWMFFFLCRVVWRVSGSDGGDGSHG